MEQDKRSRHQFHLSAEGYERLQELKEELGIQDNGAVLEMLLDASERVLALKADYEALLPRVEERERAVARLEAELEEKRRTADEFLNDLRAGTSLPQQAWAVIEELVGMGWRIEDLTDTLLLLGELKLPPAPAAEAIRSIGGAINYARKLAVEVKELQDKRAAALSDLQAATKALHQQLEDYRTVQAAVQQALAVRDQSLAFAREVTRAYADCGLVLENLIDPLVASEDHGQVLNLSERAKRVLAGTIITMIASEHGDSDITLPAGGGRLVPSRVMLSELPRLLAPSEAYREQERIIMETRINAAVYRRLAMREGDTHDGGDQN